jgi:hypothetical protein
MENHHIFMGKSTISMAFNRKESKHTGNSSFLIAIWQGLWRTITGTIHFPAFLMFTILWFETPHKHPKNQRP